MKIMSKWVQDAGHGGNDGGASHNGIVEKNYTLEASLYVNKRLNELGIVSYVTRSKDVNLSNIKRTNIVRKYDKCISHHFNAGGGTGVEVIHSIYSDGKFEKLIIDEFRKAGYPIRNKPIYTRTLPKNKNRDYYFMHRETGSTRTTILEYDFVDGKNNSKLKDKKYREGMYECVIRAICKEEKVKYVAPNTKKEVNKEQVFYRVVTGSFTKRKNAEKRVKELEEKGYQSFIEIFRK